MNRRAAATLAEGVDAARQAIRRLHRTKSGSAVARAFAAKLEKAVCAHLDRCLAAHPVSNPMAAVLLGGSARRMASLHSDLDIAFLYRSEPGDAEAAFMRAFLHPLIDAKVEVGHSSRTAEQTCEIVAEDFHTATAFVKGRFLWGDESLAQRTLGAVAKSLRTVRRRWFLDCAATEVAQRRSGEDALFLLEPHVKDSRGALRDWQTVDWIAFALGGDAASHLRPAERRALAEAQSFFIELRNAMHLAAGRRSDQLSIEMQIRVARPLGYEGADAMLPEEQMMRAYYHHARMVDRALEKVLAIAAARQGRRTRVATSLTLDRRDPGGAFEWALGVAKSGESPSDRSIDALAECTNLFDEDARTSERNRDRFLAILRSPAAYRALVLLHRHGVLGAYIPEFRLVDRLPRIDHYHRYTVDEHLLRSVRANVRLRDPNHPAGDTAAGHVARQILRWDLLNFALLLHDVGKGEGRGHVIRGSHAAKRAAERIGLNEREADIVHRLVKDHQRMSHMILRRDPSDPNSARELGESVEEPEVLRMLYIHTACDMMAVSPQSWNQWRAAQLHTLFDATMRSLRGLATDPEPKPPDDEFVDAVRASAPEEAKDRIDARALEQFLSDMPERYRRTSHRDDIARHFLASQQLDDRRRVRLFATKPPGADYHEVTCVARDCPGLFSNLCGAIASRRLNVISAQVFTGTSGVCVDIFQVQGADARTVVLDDDVLERLSVRLNNVLIEEREEDWTASVQPIAGIQTVERRDMRPPNVRIDNSLSQDYTVVEVKAPDRPGLLLEIARVFDRHRLNIHLALISTESYRVVDVFYITDLESNKFTHPPLRAALERDLLAAVSPPPKEPTA